MKSYLNQVCPQLYLHYKDPNKDPTYNALKPSSEAGIRMLLDGQIDFALSSRPLKLDEINEAKKRGFEIKDVEVGINARVIAVNHRLDISSLTVEQFDNIFNKGKLTNWKQVGGPDLKIRPYDTNGSPFGSTEIIKVDTPTVAIQKVAQEPGGIFSGSALLILSQCSVKPLAFKINNKLVTPYQEPLVPLSKCSSNNHNQVDKKAIQSEEYPTYFSNRLRVVIKVKENSREQKVGEAYANLLKTKIGQDFVEKAGFLGIPD